MLLRLWLLGEQIELVSGIEIEQPEVDWPLRLGGKKRSVCEDAEPVSLADGLDARNEGLGSGFGRFAREPAKAGTARLSIGQALPLVPVTRNMVEPGTHVRPFRFS